MIQCEGQLSLMDLLAPTTNEFKPGDWIEAENVGEQLTFDEIAQMINQLIVMDMSTVSHAWYKVIMVEKIVMVENADWFTTMAKAREVLLMSTILTRRCRFQSERIG